MRILGAIALILVFTAGAAAATPAATKDHRLREKEIRQWLDAEWERAARLPDLGERRGISWTAKQRVNAQIPRELLNRLPSGATVTRADAGIECALFCRGDDLWRFNSHPVGGEFVDQCYSPKGSWKLGPSSIEYFDPREVDRRTLDQDVLAQRGVFTADAGRLLFGDLSWRMVFDVEKDAALISENGWTVIVHTKSKTGAPSYAVRYSGIWSDEANRGFVVKTESPVAETTDQAGVQVDIYDDWKLLPDCGLWSAGRIATFDGLDISKEPKRTIALVGEVNATEDPYTPPVRGRLDAVRGEIMATTVLDHVNRKKKSYGEGGEIAELQMAAPVSSSAYGWLRTTGWVLLGCVGAALLIVWRVQCIRGISKEKLS